jgi:hypothetical protein
MEGYYSLVHPEEGAIGATVAGYDDAEDAWFDLKLWAENDTAEDNKVETGKK